MITSSRAISIRIARKGEQLCKQLSHPSLSKSFHNDAGQRKVTTKALEV